MRSPLLLILIFVCLSGCGNDDDNAPDDGPEKSALNPPDWILGTWTDEADSDFGILISFEFLPDNVKSDVFGISINFKEMAASAGANIDEVSNSSVKYSFRLSDTGGLLLNQVYLFQKTTDDNAIIYTLTTDGVSSDSVLFRL